MSGELKIDREYIILAGSDVAKVKVLDVTATSIRVHNLDDDFIKRYLLEDYKPRVIEELPIPWTIDELIELSKYSELANDPDIFPSNKEVIPTDVILESVTILEEHPTKAMILGKSNAERLAEILQANSQKEVEELVKEDKEIWKEIPNMGLPYLLSNKGRIKGANGKILKPYTRQGSNWYQLKKFRGGAGHYDERVLLRSVFGLEKV